LSSPLPTPPGAPPRRNSRPRPVPRASSMTGKCDPPHPRSHILHSCGQLCGSLWTNGGPIRVIPPRPPSKSQDRTAVSTRRNRPGPVTTGLGSQFHRTYYYLFSLSRDLVRSRSVERRVRLTGLQESVCQLSERAVTLMEMHRGDRLAASSPPARSRPPAPEPQRRLPSRLKEVIDGDHGSDVPRQSRGLRRLRGMGGPDAPVASLGADPRRRAAGRGLRADHL